MTFKTKDEKKDKGVNLKCPNCGYTWEYKGTKRITAQCPDCTKRIDIRKAKIKKR